MGSADTNTHTHTRTRTPAATHAATHARTRARAQIRSCQKSTHTHTNTHARAPKSIHGLGSRDNHHHPANTPNLPPELLKLIPPRRVEAELGAARQPDILLAVRIQIGRAPRRHPLPTHEEDNGIDK